MVLWNAPRAKIQLKTAVQRLRSLQEKKESLAKQSRREIATLIEKGKLETARIKVENIINEDIHVELLELLELYCELLIARFGILELHTKEPDPAVEEGVCAVIHAAHRTEIKELHILRDMLMQKYGREFSVRVMENEGGCVSERVTKKLVVATPSKILVNSYLREIAKGYRIDWSPPEDGDSDTGGGGGLKEPATTEELEPLQRTEKAIAVETQSAALPSPPSMPSAAAAESGASQAGEGKPKPVQNTEEDEFAALAARFDALKRRK